MTIQEMHYDFKTRLNKIDSSQYRNLLIPEIDRKLNEAAYLFVKMIANPRVAKGMGLEINQRTTDDIRTIVKDSFPLTATLFPSTSDYVVTLPSDYLFYIDSEVEATKGTCKAICQTYKRKHIDRHKESPFDISNFEWREVNIHFTEDKIRIFTDGTFVINTLYLDYITTMPYMHFASGFSTTGYLLPGATVPLTTTQNCILPDHLHSEIIDIAVLITSGELNATDYQLKITKTQLNQ